MYGLRVAREIPVVWMPGGVRTEIHLTSEDTGGAFCLLVDQPPSGWSLPAHRHSNEAETIHIVEGDFVIEIDGERSRSVPGRRSTSRCALSIRAPTSVSASAARRALQSRGDGALLEEAGCRAPTLRSTRARRWRQRYDTGRSASHSTTGSGAFATGLSLGPGDRPLLSAVAQCAGE